MLNNIADSVGLKAEYVAKDTYEDAIKAVQKGETMLVSGVANDPAAALRNDVNLTKPYITINYSAVTKRDIPDLYVEGVSYKAAVCAGSYSTMVMMEKMPSYEFVEYHNNDECMAAVNNGDVDIALVANQAAEYYSGKHDYAKLSVSLIDDFSWGLSFGVNKNCDAVLIDILNKGITALNENDINQASYRGLIDANKANQNMKEWIYDNVPVMIAMVTVVTLLLTAILFLLIFQRHKLNELKTRKVLQDNIDEQQHFLNSIPTGVGIFEISDNQSLEKYMNDRYYLLVEEEREERKERLGNSFVDGMYEDDKVLAQEAIKKITEGSNTAAFNFRAVKKNGEFVWLRMECLVARRTNNEILVYGTFTKMDEVILAEQALEEKSAALEASIKNADISVWSYDLTNQCLVHLEGSNIRHAKLEIIRNFPESLIEKDYIHPDYIQLYRHIFKEAERGNQVIRGEFLMREYKGKSYWWERVILVPVRNENGVLTKIIVTSMDITEQKAKETTYISQIDAMAAMNDDNLLAKGRHNLSKNVVQYYYSKNDALKLREGNSYDDAVAAISALVMGKEEAAEISRLMSREKMTEDFKQGKREGSIESKLFTASEHPIWINMKYTLYEEPVSGEMILFIYSYDVTERVLENQIINKLSNLEYEIVGLLDPVSRRYRITNIQSDVEGLPIPVEGDFDEVARQRFFANKIPSDDYEAHLLSVKEMEDYLKKHEIYQLTYSVYDQEENIRQKRLQCSYLNSSKNLLLCSRSDITNIYLKEQKQIRQIESALKEAKSANHAKTEFFSRMSHDMRTPMNGILGLAALSREEENLDVLKDNIGKIEQSGEYLLGLINDTLDFQKIEAGKMTIEPEAVRSEDLLDNIVDMIRQTAKNKGVNLRVINKNADLNAYVNTDPLRLKQIFVNLLSNAVKFTPKGGTVEFILECMGCDEMISHDVFTVRDTGIGMSGEFIKNEIFTPFSQERNEMTASYAGSGLGLSIAKKLVELMDGTITVESELGAGTTFMVHIDFEHVDEKSVKKTEHANEKREMHVKELLRGKRILLVEDHPLNGEITSRLLKKVECEVTWKQNGAQGAQEFASAGEYAYDAILMDIRMPVMDGIEAAKTIRRTAKKDAGTIPIIAMTANAYDTDIQASKDAGMNEHLAKPIAPQELYSTLMKYISAKK